MKIQTSCAATDDDERALIVEWLAGLYLEPLAIETVKSFRGGPGALFLDALALHPECSGGVGRMRAILLSGDDPNEIERRLSIGFSLLFDGIAGPRTVSPYESAYSSSSHRLFQKPTGDMNELLRQANASVRCTVKEPADHLSVELALLARMMRDGASRQDQCALLDFHLLAFVPKFAARCLEADRTGFYAAAADLLMGFLHARRQSLREARDHVELSIETSPFKDASSVDQDINEVAA